MLILASHLSYMQDSFATKLLQLFFFFNSRSVFVLCFLSFFFPHSGTTSHSVFSTYFLHTVVCSFCPYF